jgi:rfaE bifunctional protein nucleotidyltransferase chain/domain/rfaE bifunctional protein kinase chain/domain
MTRHVVVIGDAILDRTVEGTSERLAPDAPVPVIDVANTLETPGGAGLAALMCADLADQVTLIAPIGDDPAGRRLTALLTDRITLLPCRQDGSTRTKTRVRSAGQSLVRIDEGGPAHPTDLPLAAIRDALARADAVLVSDYGAGMTADATVRAAVTAAAARTPVVWDPHPRGGSPVEGTAVVTPNLAEARRALAGLTSRAGPVEKDLPPAGVARILAARWPVRAVAVTAGAAGAFLAAGDQEVRYLPAVAAPGGDPCGAGDRFAATVAAALAGRELLSEAVRRGVADASAWVRGLGRPPTGGPSDPAGRADEPGLEADPYASPADLGRALRAGGRTVVATGGCFDIVHAGHVATLQAARRLGDRLVVLVNSDASVRRLKGPERPVVGERDRARVLQALDCVDAVLIFDDDHPGPVLDRLRPDVWVKGGDYGGTTLPESDVVARHGGSTVFVPYLTGHSTTTIIERARTTGRHHPADHNLANQLEDLR